MKKILIFYGLVAVLTVVLVIGAVNIFDINFGEETHLSGGIFAKSEITTLKCYFHNVVKENENKDNNSKIWNWIAAREIWLEYSGVAEYGINVEELEIEEPTSAGKVLVKMPKAKVLSVYIDDNSIGDPLEETGWARTKHTVEEQTSLISKCQDDMRVEAESNTEMLKQARDRAKNIIESYIKKMGQMKGEEYQVVFSEID